ncbi:MAG TPA: helix-turn-helix transcriptional regulator [Hyphomicrobiaceae bacterium]|nr:helix-turn-helix transcriptional regulator [Hyphomicrobiaceae bacterium]
MVDEDEEKGSRRPNPIDVHVGSRVRLQRMLLGISQEKLGERLGLTFQQVQKYEKGVNRIGASRLFDLAQVLQVPVQFFYDDAPVAESRTALAGGFAERSADGYIFEFLSTREGLELNRAFARISDPKTRRAILDLVRSLAGEDDAEASAAAPGGASRSSP